MKIFLMFLCMFVTSASWAQKIIVGDVSYADFQLQKLKSIAPHTLLISWGQMQIQKENVDENFFIELEQFENDFIFIQEDRKYLIDLLERLSEKTSSKNKDKIQILICKWKALTEQNNVHPHCGLISTALQTLKDHLPEAEWLVAEDMGVPLENQYSFYINPQATYNWKILSSVMRPISFHGSFAELQNQNFSREKIIQGECDSFTHSLDDLEVISQGSVLFSANCRRSLNKPETSSISQWYEKNKSWVLPVGIAILAATAYQMKDKKLVIHRP